MLTEEVIKSLMGKVNELRVLFSLGQNFIPYLDELFVFFNDIKPIMDEIQIEVNDNLLKIPTLAKQLAQVTEANELATSEIMNVVDTVVSHANDINQHVDVYLHDLQEQDSKIKSLLEQLIPSIEKGENLVHLLPVLKDVEQYYIGEKKLQYRKTAYETLIDLTNNITNECNAIFMSLQVQDISAQQIAAVNNMLSSVQGKLKQILEMYNQSNLYADSFNSKNEELEEIEMHREIVFDPHAITALTDNGDRQADIDKMMIAISENKTEVIENMRDSREQQNKNNDDLLIDDIPTLEITNTNEGTMKTVSQADIDALFGN